MERVEEMESIPPNANPFHYDAFHMGVGVGSHVEIMYAEFNNDIPYIIIINKKTGERWKFILSEEHREIVEKIGRMVQIAKDMGF